MVADMSDLHAPILRWYDANARDLPWRGPGATPWAVMVSEFMLQQTPVARVLPVFESWMSTWPTPGALAAVPSGEAVRAWGRLGYPRRALRLHAAAQAIVDRHDGEVPASYDDLLALPGVGDYTASAIASFAFGGSHAVLDTNVRRVFARAVSGVEFPSTSVTKAEKRARRVARTRRAAGHLGGGGDGARRAGLHGREPEVRRVPGQRPVRLEPAPAVRRTTDHRAAARRGPAPTGWSVAG